MFWRYEVRVTDKVLTPASARRFGAAPKRPPTAGAHRAARTDEGTPALRTVALLFLVFLAVLSGCGTGTGLRVTSLSDRFIEKQWAREGFFGERRRFSRLYARLRGGRRAYVGTTVVEYGSRSAEEASEDARRQKLAVSLDGRSVVFEEDSGICLYEIGSGKKVIHKGEDLHGAYTLESFPRNLLAFTLRHSVDPASVPRALTAEGKEGVLALFGGTPLHEAAYEGRLEGLDSLLDKGEDIDSLTHFQFTALDIAIVRGHEKAAVRLVERGADPMAGKIPSAHLAVNCGRMKALEAMVARGLDVNAPHPSGRLAPFTVLLAPGKAKSLPVSDPAGGPTLLHVAFVPSIYAGELEAIFGPYLHRRYCAHWRPRWLGGEHGAPAETVPQMVKWLLDHGADPRLKDDKGITPILYLAMTDPDLFVTGARVELELAELLLRGGAEAQDRDDKGRTALQYAVARASVASAEKLIERGADVNARGSEEGWTPLHIAAMTREFKMVKLLIERGADVNARGGEEDLTPLHIAAMARELKMVKLLIERGADVNARGGEGETPLHVAALTKEFEIVKLLVEHGADVDVRDKDGDTALHCAAIHFRGKTKEARTRLGELPEEPTDPAELEMWMFLANYPEGRSLLAELPAQWTWRWSLLELLVSHSKDIDARNNKGLTPLMLAVRGRKMWTAAYLSGKGADASVPDAEATPIGDLIDGLMDIRESVEPSYVRVSVGWRIPTGTVSAVPGGPSFPSTSAAEVYGQSLALGFGWRWERGQWLYGFGGEFRFYTPLTDTGKTLAGLTPLDDVRMEGMGLEFFAGRGLSLPGSRLRPFAGLSVGFGAAVVNVEGIPDFGDGERLDLAARAGIDWHTENPNDLTIGIDVRYPLLALGIIPDEVVYCVRVSSWQ